MSENSLRIKLAEQAEDYVEVISIIEQFSNEKQRLLPDDRAAFAAAVKNGAGSLRFAIKAATQTELRERKEKSANTAELASRYRKQLITELIGICERSIAISEKLERSAVNCDERVVYLKIIGDCFRYKAEIEASAENISAAAAAYAKATALATDGLHPADPIKLGLFLNRAVFEKEILNDLRAACLSAREAFELGSKRASEVPADSATSLQLLRDNLTLWTSQSKFEITKGQK